MEAREAAEKVRKLRKEPSNWKHDIRKALARIRELEAQPPILAGDTAETSVFREKLMVVQEEEDAANRGRRDAKVRVLALEHFNEELKKTNEHWLYQSQ